jgi:hypothetical protein
MCTDFWSGKSCADPSFVIHLVPKIFSTRQNQKDMRYTNRAWALLLLLSVLNAASVQADTLRADKIFDSVSIYAGQGVNHNLKELPDKILTGLAMG